MHCIVSVFTLPVSHSLPCFCSPFTERVLANWTEYDALFEEVSNWLKHMEDKVRSISEFKATLSEKQVLYDLHKVKLIK